MPNIWQNGDEIRESTVDLNPTQMFGLKYCQRAQTRAESDGYEPPYVLICMLLKL